MQPCSTTNSAAVGALAVAEYKAVDPGPDGCALFAANAAADTIEYVVIAQSVATNPNRQAQFRLAGHAMIGTPAPPLMASQQASEPSPAEQFHMMLREREAARVYAPRPEGAALQASIAQPPPEIGHLRDFKVCGSLQCQPSTMVTVTAQVQAVGQHIAIYVDVSTTTGFTAEEYDTLVQVFDQRLYPIDESAFGPPSDRDNNGVVLVLMTPQINRLVSTQTCVTSGFVAGYFLGSDIDPAADFDPAFNHSEMFYALVPDPNGVYSCSHTSSRVKQLIPNVLVHEFQHMISFNHKVLIPARPLAFTETLWLNEAMSHYAEELAGRSYLPGDNATFSAYLTGNVRNAYDYMSKPGNHFLVANTGTGTLGERGAGWLFLRYVVDQVAADTTRAAWDAVTRALVQSPEQGTANIAARTGAPFEQTLVRWALALWVSDLPGFTAPPELKYRSWRFRTTYAGLYPAYFARPYPLEPVLGLGPEVNLSGYLRSGSAGEYARVIHPPGAASFTLQLAEVNGTVLQDVIEPRLTVIRVR